MKLNKYILTAVIFLFCLLSSIESYEQVPPPPPPPNGGTNNGHGAGGNQGTPGAPIGGGLEIFLALSTLYAGKKLWKSELHNL